MRVLYITMTITNIKPHVDGLENYNKIESALNNYDPTPLV